MDLSPAEQDVISTLTRRGMAVIDATTLVLMVARSLARSRAQLVDVVLTGYPGLEDGGETDAAVGRLLTEGWLVEWPTAGVILCTAAPEVVGRISEYTDDPSIGERLMEARARLDPSVRLLGLINSDEKRVAFVGALRFAQREVRLPFLATPATIEPVGDLESRARQGVRLRILLASPDVVATLRGESQRQRGHDSVEGWTALARNWPNTEVRVAQKPVDMLMAASCSFDESRAQLAVYDIWKQRSQESTVLEVHRSGFSPNLITLFNEQFDAAWHRSRPTGRTQRALWWVNRLGWEIVLLVSATLTALFFVSVPVLGNIAGGVAATALVTVMTRYRTLVGGLFRRLRMK
jgi:hypothetical protein